MNEQVQIIRNEVERLHEEYRGNTNDWKVRRALRTMLFFIDSLTEEPVSEDLEEAAKEYANSIAQHEHNKLYSIADFIAGANLQKERMIDKACVWLDDNLIHYWSGLNANNTKQFIEEFKKAMEE